ncbi:hypothetical protein HNR38_000354 [Marinobacter oulmenensis]|uniref:Uncharacterized protein n=1 Tax=Marinobacter oulmenensis TaxID=643747 RepID=A0A840UFE8_9GAMM|nr:hypothetical protein [Marinobacter oulmenensis]
MRAIFTLLALYRNHYKCPGHWARLDRLPPIRIEIEVVNQHSIQSSLIHRYTFPDNLYQPSHVLESQLVPLVPQPIRPELRFPEFWSGLWNRRQPTSRMTVPETAMDKDDESVPWQDNIRFARKIPSMDPELHAHGMERFPDPDLRPCICGKISPHYAFPCLRNHGFPENDTSVYFVDRNDHRRVIMSSPDMGHSTTTCTTDTRSLRLAPDTDLGRHLSKE